MRVFVDSNVLLDVFTDDATWSPWSTHELARAAEDHSLAINAIVLAEVSLGFARIEDLWSAMPWHAMHLEAIPPEAAFLAGRAFTQYRRRGGTKQAPLPDFFIGAHAAVASYALLTRDAARYRTYFPTVPLISPN